MLREFALDDNVVIGFLLLPQLDEALRIFHCYC